eukprot:403342920
MKSKLQKLLPVIWILLAPIANCYDVQEAPTHHVNVDEHLTFDYRSAYIDIVQQKRIIFDIESKDIDVQKWKDNPDHKNGYFVGFGFPLISDNQFQYDMFMCRYNYQGHDDYQFYGDFDCVDSIWEQGETYEEDKYQDSAFLANNPDIYLDLDSGKLSIKLSVIKKYEERPGHQDIKIEDGQDLDLIIIYGDLVDGKPNLKEGQSTRNKVTIKLDPLEGIIQEVKMKYEL